MEEMNDTNGIAKESAPPWRKEPEPKDLKDFLAVEGQEVFKKLLKFYQDHMVYQKPIEYIVDTLYDMGTYHMDKWDSTKYLGYFGSGNEKGKSTALKIHKFVAYRACPISSGTDAAFRKCLNEGGTLLCDQAEELFFEGSNKKKTFMYKAFTSGYTRDFLHIQLDANDPKNFDCRELYGAKVYCMQEDGDLDNPIKQRTFPHYMLQGVPRVVNMLRNEESIQTLDWIFYSLHALRLKKYKKLNYNTGLFGRTRELWEPDLNIIELYNLPYWVEKRIYITAFESMDEKRDQATDTLPAEIYHAVRHVKLETAQFTASHIKAYLLKEFSNKYTEKNLYEGKIGKHLHELLGLKNQHLGNQRIYDMNDPYNIKIFDSLKNQYDVANSVELQCLTYEEENNINVDTSKSVYERWADYRDYKKMQELAIEIGKSMISVNVPIPENEPDWVEPEIEYHCSRCDKLIMGTNPNVMCDDCENKVKQWELDHSRHDSLDPP